MPASCRSLVVALVFTLAAAPGIAFGKGKAKRCRGKLGESEVVAEYVSSNCGDYCYLHVKLAGSEKTFSLNAVEPDGLRPGQRLKLKVVRQDVMIPEAGGCMEQEAVVSIIPVK